MELADYKQTKSRIDSALDICGIGHDVDDRLNTAAEEIFAFCAQIQASAMQQLTYDLFVNLPRGMKLPPRHALRQALVSAVSRFVDFDVVEAVRFGADIAEDVNAHGESTQIRAIADQMEKTFAAL